MVYIRYGGRLGNILFQYTFARLLCKFSNSQLSADYEILTKTKRNSYDGILKFEEHHLIQDFNSVNLKDCYVINQNPFARSVCLNFEELVEIAKTRDVFLNNCHPQNPNFFVTHKKWIKENIKIKEGDYKKTEDLVCQVRIGDYFTSRFEKVFSYPLSCIPNLLQNIDYKNLTVITDSPDFPEFLKLMENYRYEMIHETPLYDLRTAINAKRLVVTPSTFCWWAAFLGEA